MEPLVLFAAGSLRQAMLPVITAFERGHDVNVVGKFRAAGGLCAEIEAGERCSVFASANMEHPRRLQHQGFAEDVFQFAANSLCAVLREGLCVTSENLPALLRHPSTRVGTSTPGNDPCGDYALKALNAAHALPRQQVSVTGGREQKVSRADGLSDFAAALMGLTHGKIDVVLVYKTAAEKVARQAHGHIVRLPDRVAQRASYGIAAIKPSLPEAHDFITFVRRPVAQAILSEHGFDVLVFS